MKQIDSLGVKPAKAICYSGFRPGQSPGSGVYPSYQEVKEDLLIMHGYWRYLRLYDCDVHAKTVLDVIQKEKLDFKVMLGAYIQAEQNNPACPWGGGSYSEDQLAENKRQNLVQINKLIELANHYPDIVFSLSAGNEATVDWTDHLVPVEQVVNYVRMIKKGARQPVTFCENYVPWLTKLQPLAEVVDFISIHTYPVWEYKSIDEAMQVTLDNFYSVAAAYPGKNVVITEAGWTTHSNGRGIDPENVCEQRQETYYHDLVNWSEKENIMVFFFEAFDELWKGSHEPREPEKHWGLFTVDRKPKKVMQPFFPGLS